MDWKDVIVLALNIVLIFVAVSAIVGIANLHQ